MFRSLHKDYSRIITKADKANNVVVLDSDDYNKNVREILNDSNTCEQLAIDPTKICQGSPKRAFLSKRKDQLSDLMTDRFRF